jgi:hypothetical protein
MLPCRDTLFASFGRMCAVAVRERLIRSGCVCVVLCRPAPGLFGLRGWQYEKGSLLVSAPSRLNRHTKAFASL